MQTVKIRTCDCGRVITGDKKHCSAKCRARVNMRKMRERKQVKQALEEVQKNETDLHAV